MADEEKLLISCSKNARFPQPLTVCLMFFALVDFPWFFRELKADRPKMTCWSLLCGYPRRVTQIKVHSAEGLQKQDRSGGKWKESLEEWNWLFSPLKMIWVDMKAIRNYPNRGFMGFVFPSCCKTCSSGEVRWIWGCTTASYGWVHDWAGWAGGARHSWGVNCGD